MENNEKLLNEEVIENVNYEVDDYDDDNYTEEDVQRCIEDGAKAILKVAAIGIGIVGAGVMAYKKIVKPRIVKHHVKKLGGVEAVNKTEEDVEESIKVNDIEKIRRQYDSKDKE